MPWTQPWVCVKLSWGHPGSLRIWHLASLHLLCLPERAGFPTGLPAPSALYSLGNWGPYKLFKNAFLREPFRHTWQKANPISHCLSNPGLLESIAEHHVLFARRLRGPSVLGEGPRRLCLFSLSFIPSLWEAGTGWLIRRALLSPT